MTMTETFKLPVHGSYIHDVREFNVKPLLSFDAVKYREVPDETVYAVLFNLVRRAYPEATMQSLHRYVTKFFTVIGVKKYARSLVVLYRADWEWQILEIDARAFQEYSENRFPEPQSWDFDEFPLY